MTHDRPLGGFLLEVVRGGKSKGLERGSHYEFSYRIGAEKVKGRFGGNQGTSWTKLASMSDDFACGWR